MGGVRLGFSGFIQYIVECQNITKATKYGATFFRTLEKFFGSFLVRKYFFLFFLLTLPACVILCYNKSIHLLFSNSLIAVASPLLQVTYNPEKGHRTYTFPRPQHVRNNIQIQFRCREGVLEPSQQKCCFKLHENVSLYFFSRTRQL